MVKLHFQDTYKMISMPLADFGKSFKLDQAKEVMPYKLYRPSSRREVLRRWSKSRTPPTLKTTTNSCVT